MFDMTLSLMGIYSQDDSILNDFSVPQGVDMTVLTPMLLSETAELEILYPQPTTLKTVIKAWSLARVGAWERMLAALTEEYDPLHNYDRTESETIADTGTVRTDDDSYSSTTGTTEGSGTSGGTVTKSVTGFNTNTFADDNKDTTSATSSDSSESSTSGTVNRDNLETRNLLHQRGTRIYGNIGVTTSAQMLAGELEIRQTDIYRIICDEFKSYFCILVY